MYYIYRITNNINGKTYIGQHKYENLNDSYMGSGILLHKAFKKYGIENFTKEILYSRILNKDTADSMEIFAIKKERALGKAEYNIANGGLGRGAVSDETRKKIAEANRGKHHSEEARRKISEARKGKPSPHKGSPRSEETKCKIAEARKGKKLSDEARQHMSEAKKGKPHPHKGSHHSEESKRTMSEVHKGKHWKLVNGKRVWY